MTRTLFPPCDHGGPATGNALRECRSPNVLGIGNVSPDVCDSCVYRGEANRHTPSEPASRGRVVACRFLGERTGTGERRRCHHPKHEAVEPEDCRRCPDYLFPVITPRMGLEDVLRHRRDLRTTEPEGWWTFPNAQEAERRLADEVVANPPPYAGHDREAGVIVVGGGKYLTSACVTIHVLRHLGCRLPVQLWHFDGEIAGAEAPLAALGVETVDVDANRDRVPFPFVESHWWRGWQLKACALVHAPFRRVLLLDADCYPVREPSSLFELRTFRRRGAVFWPDIPESPLLPPELPPVFGVKPFRDYSTESGQVLLDRERCWPELALAAHYNARADFTYNVIWGDKDTFPIAWKRRRRRYGRLWPTSQAVTQGILQFDERGKLLFVHRCQSKFTLRDTTFDSTPQIGLEPAPDLPLDDVCHKFLENLRRSAPSSHAEIPVTARRVST